MSLTINFGDIGPRNTVLIPSFAYSGSWSYKHDENNNWEACFYSSGTLTVNALPKNAAIDIYLVGGGGNGGKGYPDSNSTFICYGGSGGKGGYRRCVAGYSISKGSYTITIGAGGGGTTSGFGYSAAGGAVNNGGASGYAAWGGGQAGGNGTAGKLAFDGDNYSHPVQGTPILTQLGSRKYGAGGGGAPAKTGLYNGNITYCQMGGGTGGDAGNGNHAGNGGANPQGNNVVGERVGGNAPDLTGAGGGGSCGDRYTGSYPDGGKGGSGILIIRNARPTS